MAASRAARPPQQQQQQQQQHQQPGRGDLDIRQIIREAQLRWLKPLEVCEILRNYQTYNFRLNPVPPNKPPSGSLFLFDRKALRYFRKDGHNWRKKKDGKTVREAHERLKAGSVDVLHCYYAHGEENPAFQRRSYWMLETAYEHIVLVHYLEIPQGRSGVLRQAEHTSVQNNYQIEMPSPENVETGSSLGPDDEGSSDEVEEITPPVPSSHPQPSLLHQMSLPKDWSSILSSVNGGAATDNIDDDIDLEELLRNPDAFLGPKPLSPAVTLDDSGWNKILQETPKEEATSSWQEILNQCTTPATRSSLMASAKLDDELFRPITPATGPAIVQALSPKGLGREPVSPLEAQLRAATEENALRSAQQYGWQANRRGQAETQKQNVMRAHHQTEAMRWSTSMNQAASTSQPSPSHIQADENLKKMDSFGRWAMQVIGQDTPGDLLVAPSESGSYWMSPLEDECATAETPTLASQMQMDVSVAISHVQRFSIIDFAPEFSVSNEDAKVLISGSFLDTVSNPYDYQWCCMFGDVEVPAEIISNGVLRCNVPQHTPGRIPFYVTCSDRLACSEVREFDIRPKQQAGSSFKGDDLKGRTEKEALLQARLACLLLKSETDESAVGKPETGELENWSVLEEAIKKHTLDQQIIKEKLLNVFFKDKLQAWLRTRGGEAASARDEHGQGALHLAAALGYDWAVKMLIQQGGMLPDFRDGRGWTALHWAASFGREKTVLALLGLGASPGPVTDPTTKHPNGQMPSEMAAASGHKGMAGFLAERALTSMLSSLTIAERSELTSMSAALAGQKAVDGLPGAGTSDHVSLQRSLSAVRNATKAAALIHSAYRQDSFRKRAVQEEVDEYGLAPRDVEALLKLHKASPRALSAAALHIQRKFRGWKGRRDFLNLRKHVVRIQAHVRGHQARKQFKKILWVVGVVEKAVLRWRRKRVGLRGFAVAAHSSGGGVNDDDNDDNFLHEGRRQKEQVLEKAVTRVQSMARSEEGRAQYRRMLEQEQLQQQHQQQEQQQMDATDMMLS